MSKVDTLSLGSDKNGLDEFIHEVARRCPEGKRDAFLDILSRYANGKYQESDIGNDSIEKQIEELISHINLINDGEYELDSEINEEWDDWYNSDVPEFLFSDPDGLMEYINDAVKLIHVCLDTKMYSVGVKLVKALADLEVTAGGDYSDCTSGDPLKLIDLYDNNLIETGSGGLKAFKLDCLYIVYMGSLPKDRANTLFSMMNKLPQRVTLEDIMQHGESELPEFDAFLAEWISCLGVKNDRISQELLQEAQSMIKDEDIILENARKYVNDHPELYSEILINNKDSGDNRKMIAIGLEAMEKIPVSKAIRGDIAVLTAEYALNDSDMETVYKCRLDAFKSKTNITNYLWFRFNEKAWDRYKDEIQGIYEQRYNEKPDKRIGFLFSTSKDNEITLTDYCTMLVFDYQFEKMMNTGMKAGDGVGWSCSYMKEGMAFIMLALYTGDKVPASMGEIWRRAALSCKGKDEYDYLSERYPDLEESVSDIDYLNVFADYYKIWKKDIHLSEEEVSLWIEHLDKWIELRVNGIMSKNRTNYYTECASLISAYGDVLESLGINGSKQKLFVRYGTEYSRRRNFISALKARGYKK